MSVWIHIFFNSVYYVLLLLLFILMFAFSPIGLSESPFKLVPVCLFDMSPHFLSTSFLTLWQEYTFMLLPQTSN